MPPRRVRGQVRAGGSQAGVLVLRPAERLPFRGFPEAGEGAPARVATPRDGLAGPGEGRHRVANTRDRFRCRVQHACSKHFMPVLP